MGGQCNIMCYEYHSHTNQIRYCNTFLSFYVSCSNCGIIVFTQDTASPEIIEEISVKQPRQQETNSHSKAPTKDISTPSIQSTSLSFSQQPAYSDQFQPSSHSFSPQTNQVKFNELPKSQTEKTQLEVTPEYSFLPVPGDINSEESTSSYQMTTEMEQDTKPSSPLVLPIPIEKEVASRIKSPPSYDDYPSYEGENSEVSFRNNLF